MKIDRDQLKPWEGPLFPGDRVKLLGGGMLHCEVGTIVSVRNKKPGRLQDEYLVDIGFRDPCYFYIYGRETMNRGNY